jgi:hypothetical protein
VDIVSKTGKYKIVETDSLSYVQDWFKEFKRFLYSKGISEDSAQDTGALWRVPIVDVDAPAYEVGRKYGRRDRTEIAMSSEDSMQNSGGFEKETVRATPKTYESYLRFRNSNGIATRYFQALMGVGIGYRQFITTQQYIGLGPEIMDDNDIVVIFSGASAPYILREVKPGICKIVGVCYVYDIMDGELSTKNPDIETFTIF